VRFGDPETQAILIRLESDLANVFDAICDQRLAEINVKWSNESSACIVLAAPGYPGKAATGALIEGLDRARHHENVALFHAATSRDNDGNWLTAGGRVLGVTATGTNLETALSRAYAAVGEIHWEGMQYRRDIGRLEAPQAASGG
jgi:phosphoribosylamine--glycine ligase